MMNVPALTESPASTLVSTDPKTLPLRGTAVSCRAGAGIARVVLAQTFANPHAEALHVTYTFPLPADAAVSGFQFRIGDKVIVGDIDKKRAARERFEEAVLAGQTAAILEEDRSSLFSQEIGNVPPGAEVVVEIALDMKLRWQGDGMWERRFPLAAAPRYLGASGHVADAKKIAFDVAESMPVRASLSMTVSDAVASGRSPESPSHPLSCAASAGGFDVMLGGGNAATLDRDVVVQWPVSSGKIGVSCEVAGPREGRLADAHALLTIVPPHKSAQAKPVKRDVTFLLDTSGSMGGAPIDQAKRIVLAMLDGLGDDDRFEMIEFSNQPRRYKLKFSAATRAEKAEAAKWIRSLRASGGTEMLEGILEALRPSAERKARASSQVVLITDGLIGFEQEIVAAILQLLPGDARLHTVGVGSSVNRSLTGPAARAGKGIEVVLGLADDPERAAMRLRARSDAPIVVDVEASGDALLETAPMKVPDLFAGAPVLLSARVRARGGEIVLRGKHAEGTWEERITLKPGDFGSGNDAVVTLFGREAVEDAEMRLAAGENKARIDGVIEALGLAYKISTRLTSWVAIDPSASVDPRDPSRRANVPQALAHGLSAEGVGLRNGATPPPAMGYGAPALNAPAFAPAFARRAGGAIPGAGRARLAGPMSPPPPPQSVAKPAPAPAGRSMPEKKKEAAAPEEERSTIVDKLRSFFSKEKTESFEADDESESLEEPELQAPARSTGRRILKGRIVLAKNGELVIEIQLTDALDWRSDSVRFVLPGDITAPARVDAQKSTRSGMISAGSTIRIAVSLGNFAADDIVALEVVLDSGPVIVEIER